MSMEESVQHVVMMAIQEVGLKMLLSLTNGNRILRITISISFHGFFLFIFFYHNS